MPKPAPNRRPNRLLTLTAAIAIGLLAGTLADTHLLPQLLPQQPRGQQAAPNPAPHQPHSDRLSWPPQLRNPEIKTLMLRRINHHRAAAAVAPLQMGHNPAPQIHADASLTTCASSHWSADGLKPFHRYSLAGGHHKNAENWSSIGACSTGPALGQHPETLAQRAVEALMQSPSHRANIVNPQYTHVSLGIAWNTRTFKAAQHFEEVNAHLPEPPAISSKGELKLSGQTAHLKLADRRKLSLLITYDPPPKPLTPRQLAATYCYQQGPPVARIRPPPTPGYEYSSDTWRHSQTRANCPDPALEPTTHHTPLNPTLEAGLFHRARRLSALKTNLELTVPYVTAHRWLANHASFRIEADISAITDAKGPGIYTLNLTYASPQGPVTLVQHSIFHRIPAPPGYQAK